MIVKLTQKIKVRIWSLDRTAAGAILETKVATILSSESFTTTS